ncbi:MAG: dTDP-4-dehydrorhamnose 3,5-epimerase [Flavobacteriales bacterium]|nr:dTDP-4-dehydrorhamnose 3,5-epimerase [Flavobacteriales bacterium]MDW8409095.1 dTDP-4-dehydrorhamnose 3,5-epimerase [Flavobacteriales bacterium]
MQKVNLSFPDLIIFIPRVFKDHRGYFIESFNEIIQKSTGFTFVQDNESCSHKNVLRGLHFQVPPKEQGKLVRVVKGRIFDVVVDLRKSSPTYGKFHAELLSEENRHILWIPPGFAHGFLALENNTLVQYKITAPYHRDSERCILWNDPDLAIPWPIHDPILSEKDSKGILFRNFQSPF